ncbi:MAG: hypothetical protein Q9224_006917, partial [Gallowayella concinna]
HRSQNLERDPPMAVYPESITETTYQVTELSKDLCLSTIAKTKMSIAIPPSTKPNKPQNPLRVPTPEDEKRVLTPDKTKSSSSDPSRPMTWTETSFSGTHKPWPGLQDSASPEESQVVRSTQVVPLDYLMSWPGLDWEEVIRELTGYDISGDEHGNMTSYTAPLISEQVITVDVALDAVSEHFEVDFFVDKAIRNSLAVHSQLRQQAPRDLSTPLAGNTPLATSTTSSKAKVMASFQFSVVLDFAFSEKTLARNHASLASTESNGMKVLSTRSSSQTPKSPSSRPSSNPTLSAPRLRDYEVSNVQDTCNSLMRAWRVCALDVQGLKI